MTPYYQDERVTLYHGDCLDVAAWYASDILVTDPPYGIGWRKGVLARKGRHGLSRAHAGIENDGDTSVRDTALEMWLPLPAIVFGSLYAPHPASLRHVLVWEKPADAGLFGSTTGYRRDLEAVFLCGNWPKRVASWGSVLRSAMTNCGNPYAPAARFGHPHAKPVDLLCTLIERTPAGIIADPFAGSGSTLVAAKMCGRDAIGVELEERYCEVIARRLSQEVLDLGGAA